MHESPVLSMSTNAWGGPHGSIGVVYPSAHAHRASNLRVLYVYVVLSLIPGAWPPSLWIDHEKSLR